MSLPEVAATALLPSRNRVSDAALAIAATGGDSEAFARIYDRYAEPLRDFCLAMVRDHDTAWDCVQDVFCSAATRLDQLRDPEKLRPWLYAIARHEALRQIRRRKRERPCDDLPESESAEPGPYAVAARNELADLIDGAADGLSDRDRSVLEFAYRHGLHGADLADALGIGISHAHILTHRMRGNFERCLSALLVARSAAGTPDGCPELRAVLADWDGRLTILLRKRIARHTDSCPNCDEDRSRLLDPVALLGSVPLLIPAPERLRTDRVQLTSSSGAYTDGALLGIGSRASDAAQARRCRRLVLLVILSLLAAAGFIAASLSDHNSRGAVIPTRLTETSVAVAPPPATTARPPLPSPEARVTAVIAVPLPTSRSVAKAPDSPAPVAAAAPSRTLRPPTRTTRAPIKAEPPVVRAPGFNQPIPRKHRGPKPQDRESGGPSNNPSTGESDGIG